MSTTQQSNHRWYRHKFWIVGLAVVPAFFVGVGVGGIDEASHIADLESQIEKISSERDELESALASSPSVDEVEQLTKRINELEDDLDQAHEDAAASAAEIAEREEEIAEREDALAELESTLREREQELAERESAVSKAQAEAAPQPEAQSDPESGCEPGQVNINTASIGELQSIYQIGPARAEQIVELRPFSSVDDLIRVNGIGEGHLGGIKAQGVACVG